jgi:hypothetical protein
VPACLACQVFDGFQLFCILKEGHKISFRFMAMVNFRNKYFPHNRRNTVFSNCIIADVLWRSLIKKALMFQGLLFFMVHSTTDDFDIFNGSINDLNRFISGN